MAPEYKVVSSINPNHWKREEIILSQSGDIPSRGGFKQYTIDMGPTWAELIKDNRKVNFPISRPPRVTYHVLWPLPKGLSVASDIP